MAFSLQSRVVFPVDRPPIEHGAVTIDGERIAAIGTKPEGGDVVDLGSAAILPGFVNAHTHLEFSGLSRPLGQPGLPLTDWIRLVIAERGRGDTARERAIAAGVQESLEHGVTSIGEIATDDAIAYSRTDNPVRRSQADGQDCPSYGHIDATHFIEVISFSRARAASAFAAASSRIDALQRRRPNIHIGISPHAPYTVSPELLRQLIALAVERKLPVAMHLAESMEELEFLRSGSGAFQHLLEERSMWDAEAIPRFSRPLDYLRMLAGAPRSLVIHGNYLSRDEHEFLSAHGDRMSVVYCPRTHDSFGHPPYMLAELLAAGANVALGTDSRASNPDLDLLVEMRQVARLFPTLSPREILRLGTLAGAQALGRDVDVGSLTPGKLANLVAVPLSADMRGEPNEMLAALLQGDSQPCGVWIRGKKIYVHP
jgi:cytosine/adenosine deaminase-related metal-dependent hydrolase